MEKNDILFGTITDLTVEGEGIAKVNGMPFFIKDTCIGDEIKFAVTKLKKNYGYGRVLEIQVPSADRVEPSCKFAKRCGGCQLQNMNYEAQLRFKQNKVRGNLIRLGGVPAELMDKVELPIVGCEKQLGYRGKSQYPFGRDADNQPICGFYAPRSHDIIPNTDCGLGVPVNREILECILSVMKREHVSAYDESTGKGVIRHVLIRYGFATDEILVCIVCNVSKLPHEASFIDALSKIAGVKSISININEKQTNVILGEKTVTLWGSDTISDSIFLYDDRFEKTGESLTYKISPQSFYQVNPVQVGKLYSMALDYAGLTGDETVWDLYCGIGTISLFMAKRAGKVIGVEIVPQAIDDARENAKNNGFNNTEFIVGKAEEVAPTLLGRHKDGKPDVIVIDPPRKGCDEQCLATIVEASPKRVVYVSCDSATLARDVKYLRENGYELDKVRACDMFPQSVHVEVVTLLSKSNRKADSSIRLSLDMDEYYEIVDKEVADGK